jgi:prepilin-type N-terminal cleavage/methylation domain-containing protein/prepilin-type processing-associated H-X9-DG protein
MEATMTLRRRAFTLVELLVVMGLISVMMSLLLPVIGKTRAAARSTACLSNVRQLGTTLQLYLGESKGRLMGNVWYTPATPDVAWNCNWLGVAERYQVKGQSLLCPSATELASLKPGYGNKDLAWNGEVHPNSGGNAVKFNPTTFRVGSYGFNAYLTAGADDVKTSYISAIRCLSEMPAFMDCAWIDARPDEQTEAFPVESPPDLNGNITAGSPQHWRFFMARHGRGINVCFADGSARWVPLEETYLMKWTRLWQGYRLELPGN